MKTIEEKAKEYCKNGICKDCESSINCIPEEFTDRECILYGENRDSFVAGYKAAFEWISVDDELPKEHKFGISKDVLTLAGSKHSVKNYDHIIKQWSGSQNITVTHWRQINND